MKTFSLSCAALALAVSPVIAFPKAVYDPKIREAVEKVKRQSQGAGALPATPPPFDAASQYVSTTGAHAFQAPGSTDARGPCPGLNAMANHGYIPRNGIATIPEFVQGTYQVFGMAQDLSTFLAVYGSLVDGDGTSWSIGGLPHTGIAGSHGNYETDSSPLKSDLNQYGFDYKLIMSQFQNLYNRQPNAATANYNLEVMRDFRASRFNESIAKNPWFFYGPFNGIQVSQAAFTFIYRFMGNKSAENPEGVLNKDVLKSFMSIKGPENALYWVPGNEQIPTNWYKRNDADQYSIPYFETDILYLAEVDPSILSVGCNQGTVNSFTAIDPATLSGGVYTAQAVAANPFCFSTEFLAASATSILGLSGSKLTAFNNAVSAATKALGQTCAPFQNANFSQLKACPGFSQYGGPTGPIAPGAIQS